MFPWDQLYGHFVSPYSALANPHICDFEQIGSEVALPAAFSQREKHNFFSQ